jgi:hypothetical protein
MIERWELAAAKHRLSRAANRINDIIYKMSLDDIPMDSPLYKARQEYNDALYEFNLLDKEAKRERRERRRLKKQRKNK